jgi:hypothetical protein
MLCYYLDFIHRYWEGSGMIELHGVGNGKGPKKKTVRKPDPKPTKGK